MQVSTFQHKNETVTFGEQINKSLSHTFSQCCCEDTEASCCTAGCNS